MVTIGAVTLPWHTQRRKRVPGAAGGGAPVVHSATCGCRARRPFSRVVVSLIAEQLIRVVESIDARLSAI